MFKWFIGASKSVKIISIAASTALLSGAIALPVVINSNTEKLTITSMNGDISSQSKNRPTSNLPMETPTPVASKVRKNQDLENTSGDSPDASNEQNNSQAIAAEPSASVDTYTLCIATAGDNLYAECSGATCAFDVIVQGGWNWGAGGNPRCNQDVYNYLEQHCNQSFIDSFESWRKDVINQRCGQYQAGTLN